MHHPSHHTPTASKRNDAGFSVVELLLVLALVGVAIIPLSEIQMRSHRSVEAADRYSEAVSVAQEQLENVRALGFANAPNDSLQQDGFSILRRSGPFMDPVSGTPVPAVERLEVAVMWNERGEARRIDMDCLQAQR